jgi:hypothetical protein
MKKKIKSLITDDMFVGVDNHKVSLFGNYRIIGNCEIVAINNYERVKMTLYFNNLNKKFFLVKLFQSGKYHIDFFNHKSFDLQDLSDLESLNNEQLARCTTEDTDSGLLYFSNYDNIFSVLVNGFNLRLRKV